VKKEEEKLPRQKWEGVGTKGGFLGSMENPAFSVVNGEK
jgi:hypothetical protein